MISSVLASNHKSMPVIGFSLEAIQTEAQSSAEPTNGSGRDKADMRLLQSPAMHRPPIHTVYRDHPPGLSIRCSYITGSVRWYKHQILPTAM